MEDVELLEKEETANCCQCGSLCQRLPVSDFIFMTGYGPLSEHDLIAYCPVCDESENAEYSRCYPDIKPFPPFPGRRPVGICRANNLSVTDQVCLASLENAWSGYQHWLGVEDW